MTETIFVATSDDGSRWVQEEDYAALLTCAEAAENERDRLFNEGVDMVAGAEKILERAEAAEATSQSRYTALQKAISRAQLAEFERDNAKDALADAEAKAEATEQALNRLYEEYALCRERLMALVATNTVADARAEALAAEVGRLRKALGPFARLDLSGFNGVVLEVVPSDASNPAPRIEPIMKHYFEDARAALSTDGGGE